MYVADMAAHRERFGGQRMASCADTVENVTPLRGLVGGTIDWHTI